MSQSPARSSLRFDFSGQTAVISGGADGLGFALAKKLSASGATVVIFDLNQERNQAAKAELGDACKTFQVDVTDAGQVSKAVNDLLAEGNRIDILVNCAGITGHTNIQSHEVSVSDFDKVMKVNVNGCLITSQAILPSMVQQGYGRILHVASIAGKEGNAGMLAYSSSKAAVVGLTKVQGKEYATTGITINAIAPAVIRTAMVQALPDAQVSYMTEKIPMKRCGELEEFANMAAFIVSPEASFTTGFTFDLTGGRAVY